MRREGLAILVCGGICLALAVLSGLGVGIYWVMLVESYPEPPQGATVLPPMNRTGYGVRYDTTWGSSSSSQLFSIDTSAVNPMSDGTVEQQYATLTVNIDLDCKIQAQTLIEPGSNSDYPPAQPEAGSGTEIYLPLCSSPSPPIYVKVQCNGTVPSDQRMVFSYYALVGDGGTDCVIASILLSVAFTITELMFIGGLLCCCGCCWGIGICVVGAICSVLPSKQSSEYNQLMKSEGSINPSF